MMMMVWHANTINTHNRIEELKSVEWNGNGEVPKRTQQIQYNYEKEKKRNKHTTINYTQY